MTNQENNNHNHGSNKFTLFYTQSTGTTNRLQIMDIERPSFTNLRRLVEEIDTPKAQTRCLFNLCWK
ncbi:hypothetical protein GCM10007966_17200 [Legionella impletisoli]|uniref:Uncharacterized protein n=1 Tax=Legionella impletisoli TaxID=343510 RepID=A0A917NE52_9GAMM|nr:hypothetical protein GCM10007966_17200 [Legionella impletisoli]